MRLGFVVRGLTYGVIGALTVAVAVGAGRGRGESPDQNGALTAISRLPFGRALLFAGAGGLLAYALWKLIRGMTGRGPEGGRSRSATDRISDIAGGVVYLGFCAVAVRLAVGQGQNSPAAQRHAAAGVLGWPGGPVLVGIAGGVLCAISVWQIVDAIRGGFLGDNKVREMGTAMRRVFAVSGRIGLIARAIAFGLVGYFLIRTAVDYRPDGVGLDGALAKLHGQPLGPALLTLVAVGLFAFAFFSLLEARYQRL